MIDIQIYHIIPMNSENGQNELLYKSLKELGLTDHEANLYIFSLTLGPTTISKLSEHLKISRPNVYKIIAGLEKHGLAQFNKRHRNFMVESPSLVAEKLRQKKEAIAMIDRDLIAELPSLLGQYKQGELSSKIKIIQGEKGFLRLFDNILEEEKSQSEFLGSAKDFIGFISWKHELEWIKKRKSKNIFIRSLLLPSDDTSLLQSKDAQELRETRVMKNSELYITGFQLYANKVIIWQPAAPLAILIEDEYIFAMFKNIFEIMWAQAGENSAGTYTKRSLAESPKKTIIASDLP